MVLHNGAGVIESDTPTQRPPEAIDLKFPVYIRWLFFAFLTLSVLWPRYFYLSAGGKGVNPYTIMCLLLLIISLPILFFSRKLQNNWLNCAKTYKVPIIMFFAMYCFRILSDLVGVSPNQSIGNTVTDFLTGGSCLIFCSIFFLDDRNRAKMPLIFTVAAIICGLGGAFEFFTQHNLMSSLGMTSVAYDPTGNLAVLTADQFREGLFRAQSFFVHPIVFGQFMAAVSVLGWVVFRRWPAPWNFLGIACFFIAPVSIYMTSTRSSYISYGVAIFTYIAFWQLIKGISAKRLANILIFTFLLAICGVLAWSQGAELLKGRTDTEIASTLARKAMMDQGSHGIAEHPFLGYGDGNAGDIAGLANGDTGLRTIDNLYLSLALDFGIVGCSLFIATFACFVWVTLSRAKAISLSQRYVAVALMAATISILVGQSIVSIVHNISFLYVWAAYMMTLEVPRRLPRRRLV